MTKKPVYNSFGVRIAWQVDWTSKKYRHRRVRSSLRFKEADLLRQLKRSRFASGLTRYRAEHFRPDKKQFYPWSLVRKSKATRKHRH